MARQRALATLVASTVKPHSFLPLKGTEQSQHLEVLTKDGAALAPTRFPLGASQRQIYR